MKKLKLGVLGIDHGHIYDMLGEMLNLGCTCDYWWTKEETNNNKTCLLYTSPSPRDQSGSRMPSSA